MTGFLIDWLEAIWVILVESGPYLLAGFLIAGALKVLIPERWIYRNLGQDNARSVFLAAVFGVPIPLCSCSVIPTAISLKRSGASKGATTSFLISTPETGVDSIGVTYALMDPIMTVIRPLSALLTAFTSGTIVNRIVKRGWDDQPDEAVQQKLIEDDLNHDHSARGHDHSHHHGHDHGHSHEAAHDHEHDHHGEAAHCHSEEVKNTPKEKAKEAWHYAFVTLMADLTPWFILGFLVSGLITLAVPDDFFGNVLPNGIISMTAMLFIGVPLYICATASTPVAAALLAKGMDPGSALVLLLAGPATNVATIAVVRGFLGRRVLYAYLGSIAVCSIGLGIAVNAIYSWLNTSPTSAVGPLDAGHYSIFSQVTGVILLALLVWHAHHLGLLRLWGGKLRQALLPVGIDLASPFAKFALFALVVLTYVSTAVTALKPGQTGFVMSFGKVVRQIEEPGAVWHAPFPFAKLEAIANDRVRAAQITGPGASLSLNEISRISQEDARAGQEARMRRADLEASTEVLTRDESLLQVEVSVHYQIADAAAWRFTTEATGDFVLAFAESALREAGLRRTADDLLVGDRNLVQDEMRTELQKSLDEVGAGVHVVQVNLDEVHASSNPSVHYAFRDVASALEDQQRYIREGEEYRVRRQSDARAQAKMIEEEAAAQAHALLQEARGDSAAFLARIEAIAESREASELRMRLDAIAKMLVGKRIFASLDPGRVIVPIPSNNSGSVNTPLFEGRSESNSAPIDGH